MTNKTKQNTADWTIVCHLDYGDHGTVSIAKQRNNTISVERLEQSDAAGGDISHKPVFLGVCNEDKAILLNPATKELSYSKSVPTDARFAYAYRDPNTARIWFMNDGDKSGNDSLCCDGKGSSATIISNDSNNAAFVDTLCIDRGHHVTVFSYPDTNNNTVPTRAFLSNLKDGTISVIGNDPNDAISFLKTIATINLCDTRHENDKDTSIPNNAFPHGMEYSSATGKLYNLNNGYNTVAVIDPVNYEVTDSIEMKVSSNLLLSRCGRFLIGKGADRKGNPDHVMGRLSVLDAIKGEIATVLDLEDIYPSVYRFNPSGDKLYVTTAATGKGVQADNLKTGVVQIYDTSALPKLTLIKEVKLEPTDSGRRPIAFQENPDAAPYVFIPNPTQGTLSILDGETDEVINTVEIGDSNIEEFSFSFWHDRTIYGA